MTRNKLKEFMERWANAKIEDIIFPHEGVDCLGYPRVSFRREVGNDVLDLIEKIEILEEKIEKLEKREVEEEGLQGAMEFCRFIGKNWPLQPKTK